MEDWFYKIGLGNTRPPRRGGTCQAPASLPYLDGKDRNDYCHTRNPGGLVMPIYEYVCLKCSHEFEQIQKFSDPPVQKCPSCGGKVEKKVSLSSFQLKGSGWYATDYAQKDKEKKEKKEKADQSSSPSSPSKESGKSNNSKKLNTEAKSS
jgi:putative FmdB family regulatory protein